VRTRTQDQRPEAVGHCKAGIGEHCVGERAGAVRIACGKAPARRKDAGQP
jgi:hypothetical protein